MTSAEAGEHLYYMGIHGMGTQSLLKTRQKVILEIFRWITSIFLVVWAKKLEL